MASGGEAVAENPSYHQMAVKAFIKANDMFFAEIWACNVQYIEWDSHFVSMASLIMDLPIGIPNKECPPHYSPV